MANAFGTPWMVSAYFGQDLAGLEGPSDQLALVTLHLSSGAIFFQR